ncbi:MULTISPECIES: hypothetical protein [unclassified Devosia]|jgi:hypothetical protein|uniref:hypothetical protein n=1 Tax=unclassified Devosia TaxID=196773 RepID=UPI000715D116|nr:MULTISPECIES: hypothetical protein [unclassified Devosia]KQN76440.1 hypothetical protein ASE94_19030 [Devosia sp. Leaf64]KQT48024.1 hypothetical protein ASG47_06480 [Devosia sp. Leaf420]
MLSWIEAGFEPPLRHKKTSQWLGLSGHAYALEHENLGDFVLNGADLYLIARGNSVLWVGCGLDLIAEPAIRLRFRKAMNRADGVFRLARPMLDDGRLSVIADLEGAVPARIDQAA